MNTNRKNMLNFNKMWNAGHTCDNVWIVDVMYLMSTSVLFSTLFTKNYTEVVVKIHVTEVELAQRWKYTLGYLFSSYIDYKKKNSKILVGSFVKQLTFKINSERLLHGAFYTLYNRHKKDPNKFFNYFRMNETSFCELYLCKSNVI